LLQSSNERQRNTKQKTKDVMLLPYYYYATSTTRRAFSSFFFLLEFVTLRCVQCFPSFFFFFFFFYPPRGGRHLFLPSDRVDRRSSSRQTPTAGCVLFLYSHFLWLVLYLLSVGWSGLSLSLSLSPSVEYVSAGQKTTTACIKYKYKVPLLL